MLLKKKKKQAYQNLINFITIKPINMTNSKKIIEESIILLYKNSRFNLRMIFRDCDKSLSAC